MHYVLLLCYSLHKLIHKCCQLVSVFGTEKFLLHFWITLSQTHMTSEAGDMHNPIIKVQINTRLK